MLFVDCVLKMLRYGKRSSPTHRCSQLPNKAKAMIVSNLPQCFQLKPIDYRWKPFGMASSRFYITGKPLVACGETPEGSTGLYGMRIRFRVAPKPKPRKLVKSETLGCLGLGGMVVAASALRFQLPGSWGARAINKHMKTKQRNNT